ERNERLGVQNRTKVIQSKHSHRPLLRKPSPRGSNCYLTFNARVGLARPNTSMGTRRKLHATPVCRLSAVHGETCRVRNRTSCDTDSPCQVAPRFRRCLWES